ncbi:saccharopine dehydrogenase family protein [Pseudovibrio ascidiaceicola]|uniref:saccharopine dehydrogenase family protein n=1 Tax=Pseudovibrio ascidiaceicola TaxID=285279 RepID=UPI003D364462
MKILVLGGYGVFGGRLVELLLDIESLELVVSGRDQNKVEAFCKRHSGSAALTPLALDRTEIALCLPTIKPDIVIDASGPFQSYGQHKYATVEACIAAKVNYLDFADAADFVFGVSQFDQQAKDAGIFVISGVSSFPVLTASVLREISKTMEIHHVTGGIAPSPFAGVGLNVMRAIVGYAGSPITLFREGERAQAIGLAETRRYTISVPGKLPMRNTHFSLVDVPDLQVLPPEHPTMQSIWMGAGPIPEVLHKMLNWMARMRSTLRLPSFEPLSPLFYRVLNLFKYGEHRGGMFVHVSGSANKRPVEQSWHMLAEGDDGPYIPSMAIELWPSKQLFGKFLQAKYPKQVQDLQLGNWSWKTIVNSLKRDRSLWDSGRIREPSLTRSNRCLGVPSIFFQRRYKTFMA